MLSKGNGSALVAGGRVFRALQKLFILYIFNSAGERFYIELYIYKYW